MPIKTIINDIRDLKSAAPAAFNEMHKVTQEARVINDLAREFEARAGRIAALPVSAGGGGGGGGGTIGGGLVDPTGQPVGSGVGQTRGVRTTAVTVDPDGTIRIGAGGGGGGGGIQIPSAPLDPGLIGVAVGKAIATTVPARPSAGERQIVTGITNLQRTIESRLPLNQGDGGAMARARGAA